MKRVIVPLIICLFSCMNFMAADHYVVSVAKPVDSWIKSDLQQQIYAAEGGVYLIKLNTNLAVSVSARPSWATITLLSNEIAQVTVKANTGTSMRKSTITFSGKDGAKTSIACYQFGKNSELFLDKEEVAFYSDKLNDSLQVTANFDFRLEVPDWVKFKKAENGTYYFSVDERIYDISERTGVIKFLNNAGEIKKSINITQKYESSLWFEKPLFATISDIHFGDENNQGWSTRMPRVMNFLSNYSPLLQYVFMIGDISNNGYEEQYQNVQAYFSNPKKFNQDIKRIIVRGNHDWFNGTAGVNFFNTYISTTPNYYLKVKGYPVIALGLDNSLYSGETFNDETLKFLKTSLADAAKNYPDKPIFVMTHTLPYHTIIGSYENDYYACDTRLDEIFSNYPQVVSISGHTHMGLMDPRQIYQKNYTAVNDGSSKSDSHPTKFPGRNHLNASKEIDYNAITECLIFRVNEKDEIVIERWNTARGVKYPTDWILKPPFDSPSKFTYTPNRTGGTAPVWSKNADIQITNKTSSSCYATFPQAIDDGEGVNRYIISVVNESGSKVISDINQSALQYMASDQPNQITMPLSGLPKNTPLTIRIVAYDYYELSSVALSKTFTLE